MQNQNREILFYVVRSPFNPDYYSIHSMLTDRLLLEKQSMEGVKEFLTMNNPTHPLLHNPQPVTLTDINREEYLKTYHLYYNGYHNPYATMESPSTCHGNFGSYSYVVNVSDNDNLAQTVTNNRDDLDCDSDSYGDSNHLPYITGRLGHPGD